MKQINRLINAAVILICPVLLSAEPIKLHPDNPHYFIFRDKATVLITSGEHYGAVLNLDFDYVPYFEELGSRGLNQTRTFAGTYREVPGSFGITGNTLAPDQNRYIAPWARSSTPGYAHGGNKFDLETFDEEYFTRLKDFITEAGKYDIVVELVLFCPMYNDELWNVNPMKADNNVNNVGNVSRTSPLTLNNDGLLVIQDAFVTRVVTELNEFENVYYEICNEPYFGGVTEEWQEHIINTIVTTEDTLPLKHMIAKNIANEGAVISNPNTNVSLFNFHYASPPTTVYDNYGLNKALGDDETGFDGSEDVTYRREGWDFILAGGALYSNLDYSFTPDHEAGTAVPQAPGGGGVNLRNQLNYLKQFMDSFGFVRMAPANEVITGGVPGGATARALAEEGRAYAIYINGGSSADLQVNIPAGSYTAEWLNTKTGETDKSETVDHQGGELTLSSPDYSEDIALSIKAEDYQVVQVSEKAGNNPAPEGRLFAPYLMMNHLVNIPEGVAGVELYDVNGRKIRSWSLSEGTSGTHSTLSQACRNELVYMKFIY
jgi:hypothetical protein